MARGVKLDTTEIERARARLIGLVAETDVQDISPNLTLKLENNQHSGSFKARGAMNALLCSAVGPDGVLAASGGNHGETVQSHHLVRHHRRNPHADHVGSPADHAG